MSAKPKIAFFGSDEICLPGLCYLLEEASHLCELSLVVSQPDRRAGRGRRMQQNPVAAFASSNGLQLLQPHRLDSAMVEYLNNSRLSLAFVMAYGHFLSKAIREAPACGTLNFHGSILPAYRGASPVEAAIAAGERETGVCLMQMTREMDAGGVADYESVRIGELDAAPQIRAKVGEAVVPLLQRNLEAAVLGKLQFTEQDHAKASYCRKIRKEDAALDFYQTAYSLDCQVRAFQPWPGAYFDHGATRIKVGRASCLSASTSEQPGTVLAAAETLDLATGKGILRIRELQRPGGRMLPVKEFLKGYRLEEGTVLPSVVGDKLLRSDSA